jgi:uncharacterized protein
MNIDKVLKIFVPKRNSFFPLFEHSALNLVKASSALKELIDCADSSCHEKTNEKIKEIEHIGDEITVQIYNQLNKSFITPFDREDIQKLNTQIDDVVDLINGISRRVCFYKPVKMIPVYSKMAKIIIEGSTEIETAIFCLKDPVKNKKKIFKACNRVKLIEHEADEIYFLGASELFQNENNSKELLKNNKILELLEQCVNQLDDVTDTIKAIIFKMA